VLVIGVGNPWRGDDAVGVVVATRLKAARPAVDAVVHSGDTLGLCETWNGAEAVWVVDAIDSADAPGTILQYDARAAPLPCAAFRRSTHGFGVGDAIELGRAVGALPPRLVVYGVVGSSFEVGRDLSPPVARAAEELVERIRSECEPAGAPAAGGDDARDRVAG
jgi:hydrogenase maturation protease